MQDSDDYFTNDDLILDDKTLAVLDEEESKFRRLLNTQTQQCLGPPAKRQKTGPWQQQRPPVNRPTQRTDTLDDMDDLPDVSIRKDGTYGLQDKQTRVSAPIVPGMSARPSTAAPRRGSGSVIRSVSGSGPPQRSAPVVSHPPSIVRGVQSPVSSQDVSQTRSTGPIQLVHRPISSTTASSGVTVERLMEELRKKDEVIREKEAAYEAVKFAKDGEATILRKRIDKTAQEHRAQLEKLKAAKEEVDAKHTSLQKQYEADKERWKTEMTFRRHEEASRKHVSHFPRNDSSQRAEPMPSQRQRPSQWNTAGPSRAVPETPRRPRFGAISDFERSKKTPTLETRNLPSGFQTGPPRSQSMVGRKVKETTSFGAPHAAPVIPNASPVAPESSGRFAQSDVFGSQMDVEKPVEDIIPLVDFGVNDVQMVDEGTPPMTFSTNENAAALALPSLNLLLHDIMQTHKLQGSELPTLQSLLCMSPADTGQVQSYGAALMRILDTLGGIPADPERDFDHVAQIICRSLCEVAELLAQNNLIFPLAAVLNLLTELAYMVPPIYTLLLPQSVGDSNATPRLLGVLHNIMQDQLRELGVTTGNEPPDLILLAKETLSLYEALVCWIPDDLEDVWNAYPSLPSLFGALVHPNRPQWFLIRGVRELVWLSTRPTLCRSLLSCPASEGTEKNAEFADQQHPQITLACSLLTDTSRRGPDADELKGRIIMFFGKLSNAHPDAYTLLAESQEVIPSIVVFLYHLITPIWDGDGDIFSDPVAVKRSVQLINHAMLLLYLLVVGEDTTLDLRERLLRAQAKTYQGLMQFFVMTFGRLSYSNPPYWLEGKDRQRLVDVTDIAKVLLERVIQGPELDLIWESYHDEGEENDVAMDVDEEEVEAQKVVDT